MLKVALSIYVVYNRLSKSNRWIYLYKNPVEPQKVFGADFYGDFAVFVMNSAEKLLWFLADIDRPIE